MLKLAPHIITGYSSDLVVRLQNTAVKYQNGMRVTPNLHAHITLSQLQQKNEFMFSVAENLLRKIFILFHFDWILKSVVKTVKTFPQKHVHKFHSCHSYQQVFCFLNVRIGYTIFTYKIEYFVLLSINNLDSAIM